MLNGAHAFTPLATLAARGTYTYRLPISATRPGQYDIWAEARSKTDQSEARSQRLDVVN